MSYIKILLLFIYLLKFTIFFIFGNAPFAKIRSDFCLNFSVSISRLEINWEKHSYTRMVTGEGKKDFIRTSWILIISRSFQHSRTGIRRSLFATRLDSINKSINLK